MTSRQAETAQRLLMLGFGITGRAVCEFALRHSLDVTVSEQGQLSEEQQAWLHAHHIQFEHGGHTTHLLDATDLVVLSPGISIHHSVVEQAQERGILVLSETEYALAFAPDCPVVAVTGTNGKSSTVEVVGVVLRALGKRAWVAGNIGVPLIDLVDEISADDVIVLEVSSYQLEQSHHFRPNVGVLLNLEPDHMRRHGGMQAYARAKGEVFSHQTLDDVAILPRALAPIFGMGEGRRVFYDDLPDELPLAADRLLPHERFNLKAALAACRALIPELDPAALPMKRIRETFRLPHRMEMIGLVGEVRVVNDSKSTNAASAVAALRSVDAPVVLLLGGRSKGTGYEALVAEASTTGLRQIILFGEAAPELKSLFEHSNYGEPVTVTSSMESAVAEALRLAHPGDVLLLSPACSSFDAFANYVERGERFSRLIRALPGFRELSPRT